MSELQNRDAAAIVWKFLEKKRAKHQGQAVDFVKYSLPLSEEDSPPIPKAKPDLPTTPKANSPKTTPGIQTLKSFSILLFVFFILAWCLTVKKTHPPNTIETTQYLQTKKNTERLAKAKARKQAEEYEKTIKQAKDYEKARKQAKAYEKARKQAEEYEKTRKQAEEYEKTRKQAEEYEKARKQANERYIINSDGTVIDTQTNLMWQACSFGQIWNKFTCFSDVELMTWFEANDYTESYDWPTFAGYKDWRLPTPEELRTLIYCSSGNPKTWNDSGESCDGEYQSPTIDSIAFPKTCTISRYWTSSKHRNDYNQVWYVKFDEGLLFYVNKRTIGVVRLVRNLNR